MSGGEMRSIVEINAARNAMARRIATPGLSDLQKAIVLGASNALQWSAGADNTTMSLLLSDLPMAAGQDTSRVMERMSQIPNAMLAAKLLLDVHERRPGWEADVAKFISDHVRAQ